MSTPLEARIRLEIERSGPVTFERFMALALYDPEHGYYASGRVRVGRDEGDFTTAPHLSPLFARCLARLVAAADLALGRPAPFVLAEGGPGEGRLALGLLDTLGARHPDLYGRLVYAPDETSPALARRQTELLAPHREKLRTWPAPGAGVYLSNELLDAFPVHRVVRRGGELLEVHVAAGEVGLEAVLLPPAGPEVPRFLAANGLQVPEGGEVEVSLGVEGWLGRVAGTLERGYVVTLDYGDEARRLYGPARPGGTCVAYRGHRLSDDLLASPGEQDLTAHVDFTALRRHGERLGLAASPLLGQRDFLFALGLAAEVEALDGLGLSTAELLAARRSLAPLLLPGPGMGDGFKALVLAKGAPLGALPLDPTAALG
ncbi:MAG: class I SAM-dependent methyltransferase [Deferrisomatales bacterium]